MLNKIILMTLVSFLVAVNATANEEDEMAAMQRQLNAEVMAKPFSVEETAKINSEIDKLIKKGEKPKAERPAYWRPGYTCNDIGYYGYRAYRNCLYHYRYYGRYW